MPLPRRNFLRAVALGPVLLTASETVLAAGQAPTAPTIPPGGTSLLPTDPFTRLTIAGQAANVKAERVAVTGMPFTSAMRLTTLRRPEMIYSVQLAGSPTTATKRGDVLLLSFYVRTVQGQKETGEASSEVVFEMANPPHEKALTYGISIPAQGWKRIDLPFVAMRDLPADEAKLSFRLGFDPQSFDIGGISLLNYGQGFDRSRLPQTRATYTGMEANAAWRGPARQRIERIRKGELTVRVVDAKGKPIRNAQVAVRMKRHAFPFGSAVAAEALLSDTPDTRRYQETVTKLFNRVVMENDLKWGPYEENPERARRGVAWLRERGIAVRGHNLIWPSWRNSPRDLQGLAGDKAALTKRIEDHIRAEATAFRGQVVDWDVINEPFDNHDVMDILGRDAMIRWFKIAHEADPNARLFLNDYPPMDGGDPNNRHLQSFYDNLRYLKDGGAPIGGLGFQGHFGGNVISPARLLSALDRFAPLGLPIAITEFDINTTDESMQASYMRDFLTAVFSHPATDSIIMWGFWEGRHWLPNAALYRRDWSLRPHGQAFLDTVFKEWWTNADGKSGRDGGYKTRGFLGQYEVSATVGGKTVTAPATLDRDGTTVTLKVA
jgi:GH35 family endo-1,4-beta-xylanase